MGGLLFLSLQPPTTASATFFLHLFTLLYIISTTSNADFESEPEFGDIATSSAPPILPPPPVNAVKTSSFRPSIIVIVGVLTTLFTVTFLLLLYAKHCKHGSFLFLGGAANSGPPRAASLRKNSGIDRTVVESLPLFRFGSLRGHKDGLECAVCLTRFEPTEVLRLLPKCKHAFHVECVDTWLDAHSTCPLCRYRVDPEDILLIEQQPYSQPQTPAAHNQNDVVIDIETDRPDFRRVSGRHSSALERQPGSTNSSSSHDNTSSLRMSFDSWTWFRKKRETTTTVGCSSSADRSRKDGLLLPQDKNRLEHRIIVSSPRLSNANGTGFDQRWSDVEPSDLLFLTSEMIMNDNGATREQEVLLRSGNGAVESNGSGRGVINERSVSEITGMSRFSNRDGSSSERCSNNNRSQSQGQHRQNQRRQHSLASRWVAWISSRHPRVRSDQTATTAMTDANSSPSSPTTKTPLRIPPPPPLPTVPPTC